MGAGQGQQLWFGHIKFGMRRSPRMEMLARSPGRSGRHGLMGGIESCVAGGVVRVAE